MLQFVADRIRVSLASAIACSGRARAFAAVALSTAALASPTFADNTVAAWGYNGSQDLAGRRISRRA
jgi:hypothetical protein